MKKIATATWILFWAIVTVYSSFYIGKIEGKRGADRWYAHYDKVEFTIPDMYSGCEPHELMYTSPDGKHHCAVLKDPGITYLDTHAPAITLPGKQEERAYFLGYKSCYDFVIRKLNEK